MNRALTELEEKGLIERGYGHIEIVSADILLAWLTREVGDY